MSNIVEGFSITHAQVLDGATSFLAAALAPAYADEHDIYGVNEGSLDPDTDEYENEGDDVVQSRWNWLNYADIEIQAGYLSFPLISNLTGRPLEEVEAAPAENAVQTITMTATGGDFTITVDTADGPKTTAAIAFNATNAAVAAALTALDGVDNNDVAVTGAAGTYVLTFGGARAGEAIPLVVLDTDSLTGGTATVASTTDGHPALPSSTAIDLWHEDSFNVAPKPGILKLPSRDHLGTVKTLTIGLYKMQFKPIMFDGPAYKDGLKINYNATALLSQVDELGNPFADGKKRVGRLISHA